MGNSDSCPLASAVRQPPKGDPHKVPVRWRVAITAILTACLAMGSVLLAFDVRPVFAQMNVVLIVADDLGWSDVGCYGADLHETPHLDRLAREGVRFTDAYAASVCSPTRACLLTGKHYARLGITIWREGALQATRDRRLFPPAAEADLPHREVTLAEVLKSKGYLTALVGKWHLGDAAHYPETQGFDINIGGTMWGAPQSYYYPYRGEGRFAGEYRYVPGLGDGRAGDYLTDRLTDAALDVIDTAGDRPFLLYMAHHAPHTPIEAKPELVAQYEAKLSPGLHHQNASYAAMVHSLDESVGRILERLQCRGLAQRTLVVFVSDNGGHIGRFDQRQVTNNYPLRSGKGSLYEGGIRVPLIIRPPGAGSQGRVCHQPVYVGDLFPTVLEITEMVDAAPSKTALDGLSLLPLLTAPEANLNRTALYFHYPHYYATTTPASAVRSGDWKLIEYYEDGRRELYNLREDLGEKHDLAATQVETCDHLRALLDEWRWSVGARLPQQNSANKAQQ